MSIELAAVDKVFDPPAHFIVEVSVLEPVASCVIIRVMLCPETGLVNAEKVTLPVSVIVLIDPSAALGVIVAP